MVSSDNARAGWREAVLLLAGATVSGCPPPSTYDIHRAALIQPPAPPVWSGRTDRSGITLGSSTVVWERPPKRHALSDSGLYVSRYQLDAIYHLHGGQHVELWLPASYGLLPGSFAAAPCLVPRPTHGTSSGGVGVGAALPLDGGMYLAGSLEVQLALVPSRVIAVCLDNCWQGDRQQQETELVGVVRASTLAGWDAGSRRLWGGVAFRNHPTNVRLTRQVVERGNLDEAMDAGVDSGPLFLLPGVGSEVDLSDHMSLRAQLYLPLAAEHPVLVYGAMLGVAIDVHAAE